MRYIKNLSDLGLNSKANWDAVVSALPDASVITIAAFRSDYPNLTNPGTGNRRVITVMRPYFGYVTIQDWDVDNNTIYYRTHTGNNYTAWKNIG